ncbi:MAG: sporulation transcriptional regulator SpoIIID [Clostridia bacterium]|nr:sporulation transcriptional regulator SpoIIID [Clostridia bacterium]
MDFFGKERSEVLAEYVIETGATVRAAAAHFGISKSTVHKDLTHKLYYVNKTLYRNVKQILDINKSQRHLRGGEATRRKYKEAKAKKVPKN